MTVASSSGDPISEQKYRPFLEAIETENSDFGVTGTGWAGLDSWELARVRHILDIEKYRISKFAVVCVPEASERFGKMFGVHPYVGLGPGGCSGFRPSVRVSVCVCVRHTQIILGRYSVITL